MIPLDIPTDVNRAFRRETGHDPDWSPYPAQSGCWVARDYNTGDEYRWYSDAWVAPGLFCERVLADLGTPPYRVTL
jgi:hypothetical protein